jgi:adenylate kinase
MNSANPDAKAHDLHAPDPIADQAHLIFRAIWTELESALGRQQLRFPKEIIWLNGAPGSGKGTNTPFILRERGITAPPLVVSSLLDAPEFRRLKDQGSLIGDREVIGILFRRLLDPTYAHGVLVDGFPRTRIQAECLKFLHQKMLELRKEFAPTPLTAFFPRPVFRITVLYVDEGAAISRQLHRGTVSAGHNQRVKDTGVGEPMEERATDTSEDAARKRYRVFRDQSLDALNGLKKHFHYHLINAQGGLATVEANVIREFQYQSSLELETETIDSLNHIPLASDLGLNARQNLVRRLDGYQREHTTLLRLVIATIEREFMPVIQLHAITGLAYHLTENPLFEQELARTMVVDVLAERGYFTMAQVELRDLPYRFDTATGEIFYRKKSWFRFQVRFQGSVIRRGH